MQLQAWIIAPALQQQTIHFPSSPALPFQVIFCTARRITLLKLAQKLLMTSYCPENKIRVPSSEWHKRDTTTKSGLDSASDLNSHHHPSNILLYSSLIPKEAVHVFTPLCLCRSIPSAQITFFSPSLLHKLLLVLLRPAQTLGFL